jgi:hypothetical protein
LLAVRDMQNLLLIAKKQYLRAALILPLAGFAAFTGCSSIDGSAGNQPTIKAHVATYVPQNLEKPANPVAEEDDAPDSEWFY